MWKFALIVLYLHHVQSAFTTYLITFNDNAQTHVIAENGQLIKTNIEYRKPLITSALSPNHSLISHDPYLARLVSSMTTNHPSNRYPDLIAQIANNTYMLYHANNAPYVTYFGKYVSLGSNELNELIYSYYRCEEILWSLPHINITCYNVSYPFNTTLSNGSVIFRIRSTPQPFMIQLQLYNHTIFTENIISLAAFFQHQQYDIMPEVYSIASSTAARHKAAQVAVAFIYLFAMLVVLFIVLFACLWQSWLIPFINIYGRCCAFDALTLRTSWIIYSVCISSILALITGLTGLAGIILSTGIILVHGLLIFFGYCIWQRCLCRKKKQASDVELHRIQVHESKETQEHREIDDNDEGSERVENAENAARIDVDPNPPVRSAPIHLQLPTNINTDPISMVHTTAQGDKRRDGWQYRPEQMGKRQCHLIIFFGCGFILWIVVAIAVYSIWSVRDYYVYRRNFPTGPTIEFIPQPIAKAVNLVYAFDRLATKQKLNNIFFAVSREWCGPRYSRSLTSDDDKRKSIYDAFISKYNIDMSIYNRTSYQQYTTVNDWFGRELAVGVRPIAEPGNDRIIISAADARVMAFQRVPPDQRVWLKGNSFTVQKLLGFNYQPYQNAGMIIHRLAPQDYHRFHTPIDGPIESITPLSGGLQSVNADAMTADVDAIYNKRTVVVIRTPSHGIVSFVAIGATCVGSIVLFHDVGSILVKGSELGMFQFGGSTTVTVFESDQVTFDEDLLLRSRNRVEVLLQMGQRIGTFIQKQ